MNTLPQASPIAQGAYVLASQLDALLACEPDEDKLHHFIRAYTNLTHIVSHVEGNAKYLQRDQILKELFSLLRDGNFQARALDWFSAIKQVSASSRQRMNDWRAFFEKSLSTQESEDGAVQKRLVMALDNTLRTSAQDVSTLLGRLDINHEPGGQDAAFFGVASRVNDIAMRSKLQHAWLTAKNRRNDDAHVVVHRLVESRFLAARKNGLESPLHSTLRNATIPNHVIMGFLEAYLSEASDLARELSRRLQSTLVCETGWAVDFPRFLHATEDAKMPLAVPFGGCIDLLSTITSRIFGLALGRISPITVDDGAIHYLLTRDATPIGVVIFHVPARKACSQAAYDHLSPSHMRLPTAYVLCRLTTDTRSWLNFDASRILFHEFGHALVHILASNQKPGISGLDYMPIERLELLSTWFEFWVYHPAFEKILAPLEGVSSALRRARRVKGLEFMKSNLHRAVCALVDFRIHLDSGDTVADVLRDLQQRHPEIGQLIESELLADFSHPLMLAHPGGSFVYPIASSYASEKMLALLDLLMDEVEPDLCDLKSAVSASGTFLTPSPSAPRAFFTAMLRSNQ